MADKIIQGRMYMPAEDESNPSKRDAFYPETNMESIITRTDGTKLSEDIGHKIVFGNSSAVPSGEKPSDSGRDVLYFRRGLGTVGDYVQ